MLIDPIVNLYHLNFMYPHIDVSCADQLCMRNNSKITYFKKGTDKKKNKKLLKNISLLVVVLVLVFLHIQFKCLTKKKKIIPQTQRTFFLIQYLENVMQIS